MRLNIRYNSYYVIYTTVEARNPGHTQTQTGALFKRLQGASTVLLSLMQADSIVCLCVINQATYVGCCYPTVCGCFMRKDYEEFPLMVSY